MKHLLLSSGIAFVLALAPSLLAGEPLKIELPTETALFKPGAGAEIANAQCLVCHSVDYVAVQPPFPRAFWAATVKKMREKYGAQLPEAELAPLLDYLATHYGNQTNGAAATPKPVAATPAKATAAEIKSAEALAFKYGCSLCHGADKKIVGPALTEIAAKYRNDPMAKEKIAEQVHHGGSGKWGPTPMPPFPMIQGEELKTLTDWILSRK